jgi:hypothetical protein
MIEPHGGHRVTLPVVANEDINGTLAKFGVVQAGADVFC